MRQRETQRRQRETYDGGIFFILFIVCVFLVCLEQMGHDEIRRGGSFYGIGNEKRRRGDGHRTDV